MYREVQKVCNSLKTRLQVISIVGVCTLSLCACGADTNKDKEEGAVEDTKQQASEMIGEEEEIWDVNWYRQLLTETSGEEIVSIVVDDFDGDGKNEAFANTATEENMEIFLNLKDSEYFDGYVTATAWYMRGEECDKLSDTPQYMQYLIDEKILGTTKCVPVYVWLSQSSDVATIYVVENGQYKVLISEFGGYVGEDGYYYSSVREWDQTEGNEYFIVTKSEYKDGEFVFVSQYDSREN